VQQAASALHTKAWGKPWPQYEGTIDKTEIDDDRTNTIKDDKTGPVDDDGTGSVDEKYETRSVYDEELVIPSHFKYRYLKEIQGLKNDLGANTGQEDIEDVLVIHEEYKILHEALEDHLRYFICVVVTGHPGIGSYEGWFLSSRMLISLPYLGKSTIICRKGRRKGTIK
jgi:hypothetical protein